MTTYLTSLVKRALGEGPAVRPVLPPSWPTPPGAWDTPFREIPAEAQAEPSPPSRARRTAYVMPEVDPISGPASLPRAPLSHVAERPAEQPATPTPMHEERRTHPGTSPEPFPTPPPPQAEQPHATAHDATREIPRPPTSDVLPAPRVDDPASPVAQPRPPEMAPVITPAQAPAPPMSLSGARVPRPDVPVEPAIRQDAATPVNTEGSVVPATAQTLPLVQQAAPPVAITPRPASERIVPVPQESNPRMTHPAGTMSPARHGARTQPPPPPAPPTIRVSIGRIEVRAVMPPAPTPAPAPPAAPMLTLEAYLRERTGRPGR
ncbi:MAG TPA: hypothetical protein VGE45_16620 [Chloroflexia bacterium]|jgi:hypothetical protein